MALTTVSAVKTHLGIAASETTHDVFLTQLLHAVEAAFLNLIDRRLESATYTQYLSGRGSPVLLLPEYPVISITSVHEDIGGAYGQASEAFAAATLLVAGTDYALVKDGHDGEAETGRLVRLNAVWQGRYVRPAGCLAARPVPSLGTIKVVYVAGYAIVPADVPLALWQVCAQLMARRSTGHPMTSERFEEYSYQASLNDAMAAWQVGGPSQVVARYRRTTPRHVVLG